MVTYFILLMIMDGITLATIPVANPAVVSRDGLDDGKVMVNCDTGASIALNQTGALVWSLIDGRRNPGEIADEVRRHFMNAPDSVKDDVAALLATLSEGGFIGYELLGQPDQTSRI
jgi:hypothetical protein